MIHQMSKKTRFFQCNCILESDLLKPCLRSIWSQRWESSSILRSSSEYEPATYCREHGSWTSSTTSAKAKPYADSTPLYLTVERERVLYCHQFISKTPALHVNVLILNGSQRLPSRHVCQFSLGTLFKIEYVYKYEREPITGVREHEDTMLCIVFQCHIKTSVIIVTQFFIFLSYSAPYYKKTDDQSICTTFANELTN